MADAAEQSEILLSTGVAADRSAAAVRWEYREHSGIFPPAVARIYAEGLLKAAALAQAEESVARCILGMDIGEKGKGFGPRKDGEQQQVAFMLLGIMRGQHPPLPKGIKVIFGEKTKRGLVVVEIYGKRIQMEVQTAIEHSMALRDCAVVSEGDLFLWRYFSDTVGLAPEDINLLMVEMLTARQAFELEGLMGVDAEEVEDTSEDVDASDL